LQKGQRDKASNPILAAAKFYYTVAREATDHRLDVGARNRVPFRELTTDLRV
jgi:hypothetical protein